MAKQRRFSLYKIVSCHGIYRLIHLTGCQAPASLHFLVCKQPDRMSDDSLSIQSWVIRL